MTAISPTRLTIRELKTREWPYWIVEYWDYYAKKRKDLWGFADLLVLDNLPGSLAIQTCRGSSLSARKAKILENTYAEKWFLGGNRVSIWAWRKIWTTNVLGRKARMWALREIDLLRNVDELLFFEGGYQTRYASDPNEILSSSAGAWSAEQLIK